MVQNSDDHHKLAIDAVVDTMTPVREAAQAAAEIGLSGSGQRSLSQQFEHLREATHICVSNCSTECFSAVGIDLCKVSACGGTDADASHAARDGRQ